MAKRRQNRLNKKSRIRNRGKKNRANYILAVTCASIAAVLIIVSGILMYALSMYPKDTIADNIYIGDVNVGGMDKKVAESALNARMKELQTAEVTMKVEDKTETATLKDLGLKYKDKNALVDQAFDYGKKGGLFSRYQRLHNLSKEPYTIDAVFALDSKKSESVLNEKVASLTKRAENATIETKDSKAKIIDAKDGKKVDVKKSVKKIAKALNNNWDLKNLTVDMAVVKEKASVNADDLKGLTDVLGTYTTYVGNGDKRTNVEVGTERLSGIILQPGEELAADETMGPYDAEHGYVLGNSYAGSEVEETYGGGVCQVTTTLYNAALYAELEIVERHPHSMQVTYVDPSRDAAVATGALEFRIKNNYKKPVYIEGVLDDDDQLTFTIYGKDTRDKGRSVEFESEVLDTEEYDVTYEVDTEATLGSMEYSGSPSNGMSAQLWKIVYEDGEEVSRDVINTSEYTKSDQIIKVGVACDNAEASALVSSAVSSQNLDQITSAIAQASGMLY